MSATITIIVVPAEKPDDLERMYIDQRKQDSEEWQEFPLHSGRLLDTFLMKATNVDLGVFGCADREDDDVPLKTRLLTRPTVLETLPDLEALVEQNADATARALQKLGGGGTDLELISSALKTGVWPATGDPAVEAAAFAHQLLFRARQAKRVKMALCWEFRGDVRI
ncbi:MAG: hypothetical protein IT370_09075 [Deltaproteobacteria bacterium]|nr:hypothetical protein [Deltaproteobacteria bacterium]